jgi:L,D-transpeptidase YcbB
VQEARAKVTAPPSKSRRSAKAGARVSKRASGKAQAKEDVGGAALSDDPSPTVTLETLNCTNAAARRYATIAEHGGWPTLAKPLTQGASAGDLAILRERLTVEAVAPFLDERVGTLRGTMLSPRPYGNIR